MGISRRTVRILFVQFLRLLIFVHCHLCSWNYTAMSPDVQLVIEKAFAANGQLTPFFFCLFFCVFCLFSDAFFVRFACVFVFAERSVKYKARGHRYSITFGTMTQMNLQTGGFRPVRWFRCFGLCVVLFCYDSFSF